MAGFDLSSGPFLLVAAGWAVGHSNRLDDGRGFPSGAAAGVGYLIAAGISRRGALFINGNLLADGAHW